jgi:CRISPR-associated protein Cmr3
MRTVALRLDPLDVLFFRDGRPFTQASRGQSGLPMPQTLAGALRTHWLRAAGCDFARLAERLRAKAPFQTAVEEVCQAGWIARVQVRGPWLCQQVDDQLEVLIPAPANVQRTKEASQAGSSARPADELVRLDPLAPGPELPGWQPPMPDMRPLWLRRRVRTEREVRYLRPAGLEAYLAGHAPPGDTLVEPKDLYGFDHRTGIVVQPDELTTEEGLIYAISLLALQRNVAFYAEVDLPPDAPAGVLGEETLLDLGGEGRKVRVYPVKRFDWPAVPVPQNGRVLLLLTTPAVFAERWRPKLPEGMRLVAAAVSGYEAFSGWDLALGGPKPTRFAVPVGSVYFLESVNGQSTSGSLAESDEDRRLGWGCALQGVWNYV